jgi:hypothetical protein
VLLVFAGVYIFSAVQLGKLKSWARWTLLVLSGLQAVFGLLSVFGSSGSGGFLGLAIGGIMVYLLGFAPPTKQAFAAAAQRGY